MNSQKHMDLQVTSMLLFSRHEEIIKKAELQKTQRLSHEAYLKHFVNDLKQAIPLWAYVDLLTISDISFLYAISEQPIRDAVARTFGLNVSFLLCGGYFPQRNSLG